MSDVASLGRDALRTMWLHKRDIGGVIILALAALGGVGALASHLNELWIERTFPGGMMAFALAPYAGENLPYQAALPVTAALATLFMAYLLCLYAARRILADGVARGSFVRFVLFIVSFFVVGFVGLFPTVVTWAEVDLRDWFGPVGDQARYIPALAVLSLVLGRLFILPFLAAAGTKDTLVAFWTLSKGRYFWLVREFAIVVFVLVMPVIWITNGIEAVVSGRIATIIVAFLMLELKAAYLIYLYVASCCVVLQKLRQAPQPVSI